MEKPRGIRNNNPLNIRKGNNWQGELSPQSDKEFEQFESMTMGVRAGLKILRNYITGYDGHRQPIDTIEKIITRWAPPSENDTRKYIDRVSALTGIHPRQVVWFNRRQDIIAIVDAMIRVECGQPIDTKIIESAYDLV